jgi:hypothetical protein
MKNVVASTLLALVAGLLAGPSLAKLPAPSEEAKVQAAEAAAKNAQAGKVGAYELCRSMDRVALAHQAAAKKAGKPTSEPTATPACVNPEPLAHPAAGATAASAAKTLSTLPKK